MELKDFIVETISEIVDGVSELQKKYESSNATICPANASLRQNGDMYVRNSRAKSDYSFPQQIEMDIAICVNEKDGSKSGIGIAKILNVGVSNESEHTNNTVSRIKFSIPVILPSQSHIK